MRLWLILVYFGLVCPAWAQDAPRLGIFGMVEGTDPLVVAGQTIVVPEKVPVISPLGPDAVFGVGDTVAVVATVAEDQLVAARILQVFTIVGPLANVVEGTATIMGTAVHIPPSTAVQSDQWVALSGLWSGDTVITSKLRRIDWNGFGQLTGVVEPPAQNDHDRIGSSTITVAHGPEDGFGDDIWTLTGTPEQNGLRVRLISKGVFGGRVDLVLWQGYASLPVASQTYMIYGSGITGTATDALMPVAGSLVTRCAAQGRVLKSAPDGLEAAFELLGCATHIPAD